MLCNQLTAFTQQNAVQPDAVATFHFLATRMENAGGFGHPNSQIDDLLPWAYIAAHQPKAVA